MTNETTSQLLTPEQFAAGVWAEYPGAYDDLSDADLTHKVPSKFREYSNMVRPTQGRAGFIGYLKGLGQGALNTVASMGTAAGGPQYLQGGGINQPQENYSPPQATQPQSPAEEAGYYRERAAEIAAPVAGGALRVATAPSAEAAGPDIPVA